MVTEMAVPRQAEDVGAFFAKAWAVYQKCLKINMLRHRDFFAVLEQEFQTRMPGGGRILDLACGDASSIVPVLPRGTLYTGVDLAAPALELAAGHLAKAKISSHLVEMDFQKFVSECSADPGFDGVVISYSIHHLDSGSKQRVFNDIFRILKPGGALWVIDGIRQYGDSREQWLARLWDLMEKEGKDHYQAAELAGLKEHIWTSDFPESAPGYAAMSMLAGFERWEFLLEEGNGALGMFRVTKMAPSALCVGGVKKDECVGTEHHQR